MAALIARERELMAQMRGATGEDGRERVVGTVPPDARFGADRVQRDARSRRDDVQGRRAGRRARRDAQQRRDVDAVPTSSRTRRRPVDVLGGGSNVLIADAGVRGSSSGLAAARSRRSASGSSRADAAVTINGLVRWTINRGLRRARSVGGDAGHGRRRDLRQRALEEDQHRRPGRERAAGQAGRDAAAGAGRSHGVRLRLQPTEAHRRSACCGRRFASRRGRSGGAACGRARVARVPQAHPAARIAKRRLHLHESRSAPATGCPTAFRPRPVRWSIAPG